MPIEVESPEQLGYDTITNNLSESSVADRRLTDLGLDFASGGATALDELLLCYGDHLGDPALREAVAAGGDGLHPDHVLVTPGAAAALFATATSLLEPGDARGRRAHQLRDQPRDATRDRRRPRRRRPRTSTTVGASIPMRSPRVSGRARRG